MVEIKTTEITFSGIDYSIEIDGKKVARAKLVLVKNELHENPYGLIEDVFVDSDCRGQGLGTKLLQKIIEDAKRLGCYKIIANSRESRPEIHKWYEKYGFKKHGFEFRMDIGE